MSSSQRCQGNLYIVKKGRDLISLSPQILGMNFPHKMRPAIFISLPVYTASVAKFFVMTILF